MTDQFRHYTNHITLVPMGGQPSIPYKYEAAKRLDRAAKRYGDSIVVLYFGDLDEAGQTIAQTIEEEVRWWCDVNFQFVYCGLTLEQVRRYNVPENPEKPGQYQWEAVSDEAAGEIITDVVGRFVRLASFEEVEQREYALAAWLDRELSSLIDRWDARE